MTRPLNARQIEAFRAVMLSGTTTAAAQLLHTTQPGISRLLAQFQSSSGVKLFEIQRGRLLATAEAKELFGAVQRHYLGLEKIEQTIASLKHSGVGLLRVACTPVLGLAVMPAVIRIFKQDFPRVRITLHTIGTHLMRDGLLNGLYDLALSTSDIRATGLDPILVHQDRSVCVMHKQHPLSGKSSVHVRDLAAYPLLTHHSDDAQHQMLQQALDRHGVTPPSIVETSYSATICTLAAADVGVGVVSTYAASLFSGLVHMAPFVPGITVKTHMAYAPHVARSSLTGAFVERLRAHFDALTP
ncbi:LysR substrate-binding domain-containing protein [Variovorax sp. LT1R16]|uniref:LysR substrate-binding domain-containing protein n=1 Tax=Variovorax sp. LT1R16 TaxID=3443728 RepID=UPI003F46CC70